MPETPDKERLDQMMVRRGLARTRSRARDIILQGQVKIAGEVASKPGQIVAADAEITLQDGADRYVSRGAHKLIAALDEFGFDPQGLNALDIGASTGGFTQVLLERGAAHVTAVDVGTDQMADEIRSDPRITNLEGVDARNLNSESVAGDIGAIVADVSFISLTKVLPAVLPLAAPGCWLVALVKPQFEVGPKGIGKGGIVRDEATRIAAIDAVRDWIAVKPGWDIRGIIESPIKGGDGNQEYLLGATFGL